MNRKLRMGMVGGGRDALIGPIHRVAAQLDNRIELMAGAFSSSPEKSKLSGQDLMLPDDRVYGTYQDLIENESKLPRDKRIDFISIVTPNNTHYPIAMAALDAGFHVVCDKPMTMNLKEAHNLAKKVEETEKLFCLTHNYTGYPMVKEARNIVAEGKIGAVRKIVVEYPQGWLSTRVEHTNQKQAVWRTDPQIVGSSCCMGDLGTHAQNLFEYITELRITNLSADLTTFVTGRQLDDDGSILLRFENGARGLLWASQVAIGEENSLNIRIYGEEGSLEWHQMEPNTLWVRWPDKPTEKRRTGTDFVGKSASFNVRLPAGHPEGFIEAFANIYNNFANAIAHIESGRVVEESEFDYPTVHNGVTSMAFLEAVVKSSMNNEKWTQVNSQSKI